MLKMMNKKYLWGVVLIVPMSSLLAATAVNAPAKVDAIVAPQTQPPALVRTTVAVKLKSVSTVRVWNLQDADILAVIDEVSHETGKSFVIDPRVSGKISIASTQPMGPQELYQVFLAALTVQGFSVASVSPNVFKILPSQDAQGNASLMDERNANHNQNIVVRVVPIENVSAQQLVPILRPLLPAWAVMSAYAPSNVLILTGTQSNVQNVLDIVKSVDVISDQQYEMIPLRNATAKEVVTTLNALMDAVRMTGEPELVSITPDNRTNSIILTGDMVQRMRMRVLISELDEKSPMQSQSSNVNVVYLHYLNAVKFAPILARVAAANIALASGKSASDLGGSGVISSTITNNGSSDDSDMTNAGGNSSAAASSPMIQPVVDSNALIITATPALMQTLNNIIAQLDVHPSQVLVEAAIVELSDSDLKQLGVQYGTVPAENTTSSADSSGQSASSTVSQGYVATIQNGTWQVIIANLQQNTNVNVLSTPSVMVLNNHQAKISEGKSVGVQSGSYATTGGSSSSVNPFNTVSRTNFDLSLMVTPQVTGNLVQLTIDQKDNRISDSASSSSNPTSNESEIKTDVLVNSGSILVLGGLVDDNDSHNVSKIPILGDIPFLGHLFSFKNDAREKKNMMVFLHPVVIDSDQGGTDLTQPRYDLVRNLQLQWNAEDKAKGGVLPAWHEPADIPLPFTEGVE
jgi:general secretion pathway protein D